MMTVMSKKGQIVLPAAVRKQLSISPGDDLEEFERCRDELQLCLQRWLQDAGPG